MNEQQLLEGNKLSQQIKDMERLLHNLANKSSLHNSYYHSVSEELRIVIINKRLKLKEELEKL